MKLKLINIIYLFKDTYKYSVIPKGIIFEICKGLKIIKLSCYHWQQIDIYI